ncbi:50S ribosomal protein L11 methyltransferase [Candidatus Bathyarchaeota archaeon]|nr:50S ribosomal protein L11 methyltransferase [Candidatus Bathyarchaeota archaeon]
MLRRKHLALLLSRVEPNPKPKLKWESYMLDAESAASMTYIASQLNDIYGRKVIDLGCGSGILAIAAALLGAGWVVGVDIDRDAIETAVKNASRLNVDVDFIIGDINCITGHFDTALMNPPFGSWHKGADIKFLRKALEVSNVVYSLHKHSLLVRNFLSREIPQLGGRIDRIQEMNIVISRTYDFHKRKLYSVKADLYRIIKD